MLNIQLVCSLKIHTNILYYKTLILLLSTFINNKKILKLYFYEIYNFVLIKIPYCRHKNFVKQNIVVSIEPIIMRFILTGFNSLFLHIILQHFLILAYY